MRLSMDVAIDTLFNHLSISSTSGLFAEIIDQLIWLIDDPGMDLQRILRDWLTADDIKKVQVALSIQGMALLESDAERHAMREQIICRWPELEAMCRSSLQL
ncbi:hypothetical protein [Herpetosiphon gulosus]|uniref:Uncharacterized protein n=1 Tax=Herpetosiphon gulosus TaxID=1973496 RepID=A0ABP9X7F6_9CHLR